MDQKTETVKNFESDQDSAGENYKSEQDDADADYKLVQEDADAKCKSEHDDDEGNSKLNQDDVDANGLVKKLGKYFGLEPRSPVLCGPQKSNFYSMKYGKIGKCIIFNHTDFNPESSKPREGTDCDASCLHCTFKELGFHVEKHQDLTEAEIKKELLKVSKDKDKTNSCFVCCFLTHGSEGYLCAKDKKYSIDSVLSYFSADKCESLAGKPKIFIIQACQGSEVDYGKKVYFSNLRIQESSDCSASKKESFSCVKIPVFADLLVAYSVFPGYVSYRNKQAGSYYIQKLCKQLKKYSKEMDLVSILTLVNYKVAYKFESKNDKESHKNKKKQMPYFCSSLTRNIKFY